MSKIVYLWGCMKTETCSRCGAQHEVETVAAVDAASMPELKEKILDGTMFTWECPSCGQMNLASWPMMYHDADARLLVVLTDAAMSAEDLPEGYTGRLVATPGEMIEKIKIHEAGLSDMVVELCKYVTCQEMEKDVDLRFLKMDGADGEITLAYPKDGRMEMLALGGNVYQDCAGILSRNPAVSAHGLARVDQAWIKRFFR